MLISSELLSPPLANKILQWNHNSGFSLHCDVIIKAGDKEGAEKLARYIMRNPVAQSKITIGSDGTIFYQSKSVNPNHKGNFRIFKDPL